MTAPLARVGRKVIWYGPYEMLWSLAFSQMSGGAHGHEYYRCTSTQTIAIMLQYLDRLGRSCFLLELVHLDYPSFLWRFCLAMRESLLR